MNGRIEIPLDEESVHEILRERRIYPLWIKISIGLTTVSVLVMTTAVSVFAVKIFPIAEVIAVSTQTIFSGIDYSELNLAVRRLVRVLDELCSIVECDD
jgi:hypothetical protein